MLRSIAISEFTRVFDALRQCVSKHGAATVAASILRDAGFARSSG
jgi:hypothetical protein